jgi:hypothetical protein
MMMVFGLVVALLCLNSDVFAGPMIEVKGLAANEGCLEPPKAATERLKTCPVADARTRIWCPNGKVFDRDTQESNIAVLRSICEMNQLPG